MEVDVADQENKAPERSCPLKTVAMSLSPADPSKRSLVGPGLPMAALDITTGDLRCAGEICMWWMKSRRHDTDGECAVVVMARGARSASRG